MKMGIPHETVQTIEIPLTISLKDARAWLKSEGYAWRYMRKTVHYRRFMQVPPIKDAEYHSKVLNNGIIIVYQRW